MPERSDSSLRAEADGLITRRAVLGGLATAVLTPALIASASGANPAPKELYAPTAQPAAPPVEGAASSQTARMLHTASALPDGRILVAGGVSHANFALSTAQIYDPRADTWTDAAPLAQARFQHAAAVLPDGRVLVTGGLFRSSMPLSGGEIYDPGANSWTPVTAMQMPRYGHALTSLGDGRVAVMGGFFTSPLSGVEIYSPAAAA